MNMLLLVGSIFAFSQPYSGEKLSRGLISIPTEDGMYFSHRTLVFSLVATLIGIYALLTERINRKMNEFLFSGLFVHLNFVGDLKCNKRKTL